MTTTPSSPSDTSGISSKSKPTPRSYTLSETESPQRVDSYLRKLLKHCPSITLSQIYQAIRKKQIKLNGKKTTQNARITPGDTLTIHSYAMIDALDDPTGATTRKLDRSQYHDMIVYEDDHRIGRNKPPGVVVHSGTSHEHDLTMNSYLAHYTADLTTPTFAPAYCYRLDRDTSGIMIAAKTHAALTGLNERIRTRQITKYYLAIAHGTISSPLEIDLPLRNGFSPKHHKSYAYIDHKSDEAKTAHTTIIPLAPLEIDGIGPCSIVCAIPHTGRMHQIRAHLAHHRYPILGDLLYGNPAINRIAKKQHTIHRHLLHAYRYSFDDPIDNRTISITAPPHSDLLSFVTEDVIDTLNRVSHHRKGR